MGRIQLPSSDNPHIRLSFDMTKTPPPPSDPTAESRDLVVSRQTLQNVESAKPADEIKELRKVSRTHQSIVTSQPRSSPSPPSTYIFLHQPSAGKTLLPSKPPRKNPHPLPPLANAIATNTRNHYFAYTTSQALPV